MDFFGFLDSTAAILTSLLASVIDFIIRLANFLFAALSYLFSALLFVFNLHSGLFAHVRRFFAEIFEHGWKGVIPALLGKLAELRRKIAALLDPVIQYLRRLRDFWDWYFRTYVYPILNLIQRLRAALLLFRIFHLKFAARLDARLAGIESQIAGLFLDLRRELNRLLTYTNLILDPGGLFRVGPFLSSIQRSAADIGEAIDAARARNLTPSELALADEGNAYTAGFGVSLEFTNRAQEQATVTIKTADICDRLLDELIFTQVPRRTDLEKLADKICDAFIARALAS